MIQKNLDEHVRPHIFDPMNYVLQSGLSLPCVVKCYSSAAEAVKNDPIGLLHRARVCIER